MSDFSHNTILITLVQTSQTRRDELIRFIESLNAQINIEFSQVQYIFVDQGNNKDILEDINSDISFTYIVSELCSLSHARNLALPHVKGKYVGFPDDDCWYEPNTLSIALSVLNNDNIQGVTGKSLNDNNLPVSNSPQKGVFVSKTRRYGAISYNMFYLFQPSVFFDENMGVGSPYNLGSGEETDYMLTLMEKKKYRIKYNPNLIVHHPRQSDLYEKSFIIKKHYSYARGSGYLMQKHQFPIYYYIRQFGRPLLGIFGYAITGEWFKSKKSYYILKGRIEGFFYKERK